MDRVQMTRMVWRVPCNKFSTFRKNMKIQKSKQNSIQATQSGFYGQITCRDRTSLWKIIEIRLVSVAYLYFTDNTDFWHRLSIGKSKRMKFTIKNIDHQKPWNFKIGRRHFWSWLMSLDLKLGWQIRRDPTRFLIHFGDASEILQTSYRWISELRKS